MMNEYVEPTCDSHWQWSVICRPVAAGVLGLVMTFHPTLFSGFTRLQTDPGDTRFNHYLLEYGYQCLSDAGRGYAWWHPPICYPKSNMLAHGDAMLSFGPLYWPWRWLGLSASTSFSLWMMVVCLLNLSIFYAFVRRRLDLSPGVSAVAGFVFAFGAARIGQLGHQQLLGQFYVVGAIWSACEMLDRDQSIHQRSLWIYLLAGCLVAQFYGAWYMGYFLLLVLLTGFSAGMLVRPWRASILQLWHTNWANLLSAMSLSLLAMSLWFWHYGQAAWDSGMPGPGAAETMLPRLQSYLLMASGSWWYRWQSELGVFDLPMVHEHGLGIGWLTLALSLCGCYWGRRRRLMQVMALVSVIWVVLLMYWPCGLRLWRVLYYTVPGLASIVAISRFGLLLMLPLSIGLGVGLDRIGRTGRWGWLAAGLLGVAVILEQGQTTGSYDLSDSQRRSAEYASQLSPQSRVFVILPPDGQVPDATEQLDGMWLSLHTGLPTINLLTGRFPEDWPLYRFYFRREAADRRRMREQLDRWLERYPWMLDGLQVLESEHAR